MSTFIKSLKPNLMCLDIESRYSQITMISDKYTVEYLIHIFFKKINVHLSNLNMSQKLIEDWVGGIFN